MATTEDAESRTDVVAVRREYDRLASVYDRRWRRYILETHSAVVESLELQGDERVLDVACGTGELERLLLVDRPALTVVGTDLSGEMLRQARAKGDLQKVRWLQSDAQRLPFADECFDWAICASSFHYFPDPLAALTELFRILRPAGRLLLVDWCDDYLVCKLCGAWLRWTDPAFHRTWSQRECRALLEQSQFQVLHAERFRVGWIWGMMRFVCRRSE